MSRWTDTLNSIVPLLINSLKELVQNKKTLLVIGSIAVLAVASVVSYKIIRTPTPMERIDGLDLQKYCKFNTFTTADLEYCTKEINLNSACQWQYNTRGLKIILPAGPLSGECVNAQNKYYGGISDMDGYCEYDHKKSTNVEAAVVGTKWVCRARVNKDLACGSEYQAEGLVAIEESEGNWVCYRKGK